MVVYYEYPGGGGAGFLLIIIVCLIASAVIGGMLLFVPLCVFLITIFLFHIEKFRVLILFIDFILAFQLIFDIASAVRIDKSYSYGMFSDYITATSLERTLNPKYCVQSEWYSGFFQSKESNEDDPNATDEIKEFEAELKDLHKAVSSDKVLDYFTKLAYKINNDPYYDPDYGTIKNKSDFYSFWLVCHHLGRFFLVNIAIVLWSFRVYLILVLALDVFLEIRFHWS